MLQVNPVHIPVPDDIDDEMEESIWDLLPDDTEPAMVPTPTKVRAPTLAQQREEYIDCVNLSNEISQKNLTTAERAQIIQAKMKELNSFFENEVWEHAPAETPDDKRTMKALHAQVDQECR